MLNAFAIIFHLLAINIWVGGMFFIIIVLGRVVASLEAAEQNVFWQKILRRFFFWVWVAIITLLGSGIGMILYRFGGLSSAPFYIQVMASLGLLMSALFFLIYFVYYRRFRQYVDRGDLQASRQQLRMIRRLGIFNMVLGLCVVVVIGGGPYFLR